MEDPMRKHLEAKWQKADEAAEENQRQRLLRALKERANKAQEDSYHHQPELLMGEAVMRCECGQNWPIALFNAHLQQCETKPLTTEELKTIRRLLRLGSHLP